MSRQQWKLLLCSAAAVGLLVCALFVFAWFDADLAAGPLRLDLRSASSCGFDGLCSSAPLDNMKGFYPLAGTVAFWTGVAVLVLVVIQSVSRLVAGSANGALSKLGYVLAGSALLFGFAAGFLFAPDSQGLPDLAQAIMERTWAPYVFIGACVMSSVAMHLATIAWQPDEAAYRPIILERGRLPVTPLSVNKVPTPPQGAPVGRTRAPSQVGMEPVRSRPPSQVGMEPVRSRAPSQSGIESVPLDGQRARTPSSRLRAPSPQVPAVDSRTKPPSQPPAVARTTSPSGVAPRTRAPSSPGIALGHSPPTGVVGDARTKPPEIDPVVRARTSSSGPIDLAARLSAAAPAGVLEPLGATGAPIVEVSIRPPLPSPEPVPPDQIPVAPESGLTIRKRTASAAPLTEREIAVAPESGLTIRTKPPSVAPPVTPPVALPPPRVADAMRGEINYATLTVDLSAQGIHAVREDGLDTRIAWDAIVGVVARRLPPDEPFESATFIDILSSTGSTLRILHWTVITGGLPLPEHPVERARTFLQVVAAQAVGAKLDAATKLFADSDGQAVQLPNAATLSAHDKRFV